MADAQCRESIDSAGLNADWQTFEFGRIRSGPSELNERPALSAAFAPLDELHEREAAERVRSFANVSFRQEQTFIPLTLYLDMSGSGRKRKFKLTRDRPQPALAFAVMVS
jgi:hypothetical protein